MFDVDEKQIFAQWKATSQPCGSILQGNTLAGVDEAQLAHVARHIRVGQEPQI